MREIRLLVAEKDSSLRAAIQSSLDAQGYLTDETDDGITALKMFRRNEYHVVILGSELPELDGYYVCQQIRKSSDIPVLIIGERQNKELTLSFFELGADDVITKPVCTDELSARIKVILRRTAEIRREPPRIISRGEIHIDTLSRTVYVDDRALQLAPKEYDLLLFFSQNPNRAFSREVLLNEVWGYDFLGSDRTVDTHIKTLRENLKPYQGRIATVWGYGYKFE